MSSKITPEIMKEASVVAALEILLSPEYGSKWVEQLLSKDVDEVSAVDIDDLDEMIMKRLIALANEMVKDLKNPRNIEVYTRAISRLETPSGFSNPNE